MATCTEKQCSNKLTVMLRVTRGIVCPECTPKAAVAKAAGAGTGASRSGMQIHNRINNPINKSINDLIAKLNGTRKLRNAIYGPSHGPIARRLLRRRRDADPRARLRMCRRQQIGNADPQ